MQQGTRELSDLDSKWKQVRPSKINESNWSKEKSSEGEVWPTSQYAPIVLHIHATGYMQALRARKQVKASETK